MCLAAFVEARGVLWEAKTVINKVDYDSNSDQKPAANNRYGGPERDQKGRGDKEGRGTA